MTKIIDKAIRLAIVVAVILVIGRLDYSIGHHYTRKDCEVVKVDSYVITIEDNMGRLWEFEGEGYTVGDRVDVKMFDGLTDTIKDDVIVDVTKHLTTIKNK